MSEGEEKTTAKNEQESLSLMTTFTICDAELCEKSETEADAERE